MEFYEKYFFDLMDRLVKWQKHENHEPLKLLSICVIPNYNNSSSSDFHELLIIGYIEDSQLDISLAMQSGHPNDRAFIEGMNDWFNLGCPLGGSYAYYHTCGPINHSRDLRTVMIELQEKCRKRYDKAVIEFSLPEQPETGCYIATAVYGSYDCPQVWTLRRYRDKKLLKNTFGRLFVKAYYAISPTVVKMFGDTKWFNIFWRSVLDKKVMQLQKDGFEDTPYYDE